MERNTGQLVRDSSKGLVPYATWAGGFIGAGFLVGFLILTHILGLWWVLPMAFGSVVWTAATAHGFRHGWLKLRLGEHCTLRLGDPILPYPPRKHTNLR